MEEYEEENEEKRRPASAEYTMRSENMERARSSNSLFASLLLLYIFLFDLDCVDAPIDRGIGTIKHRLSE